MDYNKTVLTGRLTRDPSLKTTLNENSICECSLAVNGYNDDVMFIDVIFFKKLADILCQYAKKGSKVLVDGKIAVDRWKDSEDKNRIKYKVIADSLIILSSKQNEDSESKDASEKKIDDEKRILQKDLIEFEEKNFPF